MPPKKVQKISLQSDVACARYLADSDSDLTECSDSSESDYSLESESEGDYPAAVDGPSTSRCVVRKRKNAADNTTTTSTTTTNTTTTSGARAGRGDANDSSGWSRVPHGNYGYAPLWCPQYTRTPGPRFTQEKKNKIKNNKHVG